MAENLPRPILTLLTHRFPSVVVAVVLVVAGLLLASAASVSLIQELLRTPRNPQTVTVAIGLLAFGFWMLAAGVKDSLELYNLLKGIKPK